MQRLYEWRLSECLKNADSSAALDELWAIDDWPSKGFPDVGWWLGQVSLILAEWNATPDRPRFTKYLSECATDYSDRVLAIIEQLVDVHHPEWAMISMHGDIKESLRRILGRDRGQFEDRVRRIVNRFSTSGVTGFDKLLD